MAVEPATRIGVEGLVVVPAVGEAADVIGAVAELVVVLMPPQLENQPHLLLRLSRRRPSVVLLRQVMTLPSEGLDRTLLMMAVESIRRIWLAGEVAGLMDAIFWDVSRIDD